MTTTTKDATVPATVAKDVQLNGDLAKRWNKVSRDMSRSQGLIAKHTDALKVQRVYAGRIVREVMALEAFQNKGGKIVKAKIAMALGLSTTEGKRFISAVELVDDVVATGGTVTWTTGEGDKEETHTEALELTEGEPTRAEIEAYDAPWSGNAKKMRAKREEAKATKPAKGVVSEESEESAPAEDVALSFNDLVIKLKELENTINALKLAGVELSDGEREIAENILAEVSASL